LASIERTEAGNGITVLRLNRPDKRNALDSSTLDALVQQLDELAANAEQRVLILSTTDVRAFCAGADVGEELDRSGGVARMAGFCRLYQAIDEFPAATIAVCVGNCVGAGAEIAAGCDLRVGGDNLKLAWAGARLGVPVGAARLVPLIGMSRAKELLLTGRVVEMAEAQALGLLHRTAPADEAESVALELAAQIAQQPGVRTVKSMIRELDATGRRIAYENEMLMEFQQHGDGIPRRP
jgi:enoyl-CoA hydratase/carnithine racemase